MMWGYMTWDGVGMACRIDGMMDANLYVQILEDELQQTLVDYEFTPENIIFQQDNNPKHTSRKAKEWLREHPCPLPLKWKLGKWPSYFGQFA